MSSLHVSPGLPVVDVVNRSGNVALGLLATAGGAFDSAFREQLTLLAIAMGLGAADAAAAVTTPSRESK